MRLFERTPKLFVKTDELKDTNLRAAAELIDESVGKKKDKVVTPKDVERMRDLIAKHDIAAAKLDPTKSPLKNLQIREIEIVRGALDQLDAAMHGAQPTLGRRCFCTSLVVDAISDAKVRATAQFVANVVGKGKDQLNLKEIDDVRATLKAVGDGTATPAQQKMAAELKGLDLEGLTAIETFMFSGKGGLVTHGPVYVSGTRFDSVFKLPIKAGLEDKQTRDAIADFEERFKHCGYDRVYIKNDAGELFIALNEKGKLERVEPHFRAQFRDDGQLKDSAEVLFVNDVDNSMREAVFGFWGKLLRRAIDGIRGSVLKEKTGETIAKIADDAAKNNPRGLSAQQIQTLAVTGGMVASIGVATLNAPVALGIALGTGVIATAANVAVMIQDKKDMTAIMHAIGVTVNRDEEVRGWAAATYGAFSLDVPAGWEDTTVVTLVGPAVDALPTMTARSAAAPERPNFIVKRTAIPGVASVSEVAAAQEQVMLSVAPDTRVLARDSVRIGPYDAEVREYTFSAPPRTVRQWQASIVTASAVYLLCGTASNDSRFDEHRKAFLAIAATLSL